MQLPSNFPRQRIISPHKIGATVALTTKRVRETRSRCRSLCRLRLEIGTASTACIGLWHGDVALPHGANVSVWAGSRRAGCDGGARHSSVASEWQCLTPFAVREALLWPGSTSPASPRRAPIQGLGIGAHFRSRCPEPYLPEVARHLEDRRSPRRVPTNHTGSGENIRVVETT